jgi:putative transposase
MAVVVPSYKGSRYPVEIISHCVWLYHRFPLSLREVEEMMMARGDWTSCDSSLATVEAKAQSLADRLRTKIDEGVYPPGAARPG